MAYVSGCSSNTAQNIAEFSTVTIGKQTFRVEVAQDSFSCGVVPGDRIAGFMPNVTETVVAILATTSLGAVWTSCSPDFGFQGVMDRFGQVKPKVLFAADGYYYNGKAHDSLAKIRQIADEIDR